MRHATFAVNAHGVQPDRIVEDPLGRFEIFHWQHPAGFEFTADVEHETDATIQHPRGTVTLEGAMALTWPNGAEIVTDRGWCSPDNIPVGHYNFKAGLLGHRHICFRWPDDHTFQTRTAHRVQGDLTLPGRTGTGSREFVVLDGSVTVKQQAFGVDTQFTSRLDRNILLQATDAVVAEIIL